MKGPHIIYSIKFIFKHISINKIFKILSVLILFVNTLLAQGWQWQNPKPLGDAIGQVLFIDNQTGWMVPRNTTLLKTNDGGVNWETIYTNIFFNNIFFIDKNEGWGIGRKHFVPEFTNSIYHTTDGGLSWEIQLADTSAYYNIYFTDKNNGWVTTDDPWSTVLHTNDGGKTWVEKALFQFRLGDAAGPYWVMFTDTLKGWIVGGGFWAIRTEDGGNVWQRDSSLAGMKKIIAIDSLNFWTLSRGNKLLAKSIDGGESWDYIKYDSSTIERVATDVIALDTNKIFLSTSIGFYGSTDGGNTWAKYSDEKMNGFSFISENEIWGGGTTNGLITSLVHSTDGGHNWNNLIETNNPLGFSTYGDVDFVDKNTGWIITRNGSNVLKTTNGGKSWIEQNILTSEWLRRIVMIDNMTGYIVGRNGTIFKTTNGGINWLSQNSGTNYDISRANFINERNGWVVGTTVSDYTGVLLKTTDGGENWNKVSVNGAAGPTDVCFIDSLHGWVAAGYNSINDLGKIYRTVDGGNTWTVLMGGSQINFRNILFIDSTKGFSFGYNAPSSSAEIYLTKDGGKNWDIIKEIKHTIFNRIKFINKNKGWLIGDFGIIYGTSDGGDNWEDQFSNTHLNLYGIDFIDENDGWAVGWYGTILHTTNGGVTSVDNKENFNGTPTNFLLYQNYPNPFNPSTTISYSIPKGSFVILTIYDVLGREVKTLVNKFQTKGKYNVTFNASNLTSGVYIYRIKAGNFAATKKLILMR